MIVDGITKTVNHLKGLYNKSNIVAWHANCRSCEQRRRGATTATMTPPTNTPSIIRLPECHNLGHPETHRNSVTVTNRDTEETDPGGSRSRDWRFAYTDTSR